MKIGNTYVHVLPGYSAAGLFWKRVLGWLDVINLHIYLLIYDKNQSCNTCMTYTQVAYVHMICRQHSVGGV